MATSNEPKQIEPKEVVQLRLNELPVAPSLDPGNMRNIGKHLVIVCSLVFGSTEGIW